MKPIRSRAVMDMNETGDMLVMHVLKEDRRNIEHGILRKFIDKVSPQVPIIVVCGDERIIYGARDKEIKIIEHNIKDGVVVVEEHSHTQR
jgi:hypothetical protein